MSKLLSREAILKADDTRYEVVDVPEWGGEVRVKALSGAERDRYEASVVSEKGKMNMANMRARLVALALVDDAGAPLFKAEDVLALGQKSAAALDRLFDVAMKLAGMREADITEMQANFPQDPSAGPTSA